MCDITSNSEQISANNTVSEKWFLVQPHLHAGHVNIGSIRAHAAMAKRVGYDAIFITEHDTRMNRMQGCVEHFSLTAPGMALWSDSTTGWHLTDGTPGKSVAHEDTYALLLCPGESAFFKSKGKKHLVPLLAEPTITLKMDLPEDAKLLVDFTLSQRPDDLQCQHLTYGIGTSASNTWFKSIQYSPDGVYLFPIFADALSFDPDFGLDNAFLTVTVTAVNREVRVIEMDIARNYVAEDVRQRQKVLADAIGRAYGIKIYSGFELTFGHHRNCFSAHVPVINYEETGYIESDLVGAAYLRRHDATFAYNHMFQEWKNVTPDMHEAAIQELIEEGVRTRLGGAQLLEVGFPAGKLGFSLEEHMRVWDALAMRGVRLVGYGDSDSHNAAGGWLSGNCFGTWILSEKNTQEALERAMRAGKVCLGNPVRWKSRWEFTIGDAMIGETLKTDESVTAAIRLWSLTEPVELRVINGGKELYRSAIHTSDVYQELTLDPNGLDICPVRLEVWSKDGEPLFFTNPIYLHQTEV